MTEKIVEPSQILFKGLKHPVIDIEDADISLTPPDSPTMMARQQSKNLVFLKKLQYVLEVSHIQFVIDIIVLQFPILYIAHIMMVVK